MPIFYIEFNDYDEAWVAYEVNWDDENRVLNTVAVHVYGISLGYHPDSKQIDYSVLLERDNVGDAFSAGVKMIEAKINEQIL
jgi:hypothetical protein